MELIEKLTYSLFKYFSRFVNLKENVIILKSKYQQTLNRIEMIEIYSISNITFDDFGVGWYGSVVVEALSCSCPVITYVKKNYLDYHFKWHPLLLANNVNKISQMVLKLYSDKSYLKNIRDNSLKWIKEYHSEEAVSNQYEILLKKWK